MTTTAAAPAADDDNVSSADFDNAHVIGLDLAGAQEVFRKQQTDPYDIIEEALQNAKDSKDIRKPHSIRIYRGRHPNTQDPNHWILRIKDNGDGIAQDYDDDVYSFIEAQKASSEKSKKEFKFGFKGIGMFQYTEIGTRVAIRSMYKGLIVKFYMLLKPTGDGRFLSVYTRANPVAATEENKIKYDIFEEGTDVRFYDRPDDLPWIQSKKLIERIQEDYALALIDNPQLEVLVFNDPSDKRGTRVQPPEKMRLHRPTTLGVTENGHLVRGAIWQDDKGRGAVEAYRGHKIQEVWWDDRQVKGYFECWGLNVDSSRNTLVIDHTYTQVQKLIVQRLQAFPKSKEDEGPDPRKTQKYLDMAKIGLADLLPMVPTSAGSVNRRDAKDESMGDPNGTSDIGYPTHKTPDPNRTIIEREPHHRDDENQGKIGNNPLVPVQRPNEKKKGHRDTHPGITYNERRYDEPTPLFIFFRGQSGGGVYKPAELIACKNNDEYVLWKNLVEKNHQAAAHHFIENIMEIRDEAFGKTTRLERVERSAMRVALYKRFGIYPQALTTTITTTIPLSLKKEKKNK